MFPQMRERGGHLNVAKLDKVHGTEDIGDEKME